MHLTCTVKDLRWLAVFNFCTTFLSFTALGLLNVVDNISRSTARGKHLISDHYLPLFCHFIWATLSPFCQSLSHFYMLVVKGLTHSSLRRQSGQWLCHDCSRAVRGLAWCLGRRQASLHTTLELLRLSHPILPQLVHKHPNLAKVISRLEMDRD